MSHSDPAAQPTPDGTVPLPQATPAPASGWPSAPIAEPPAPAWPQPAAPTTPYLAPEQPAAMPQYPVVDPHAAAGYEPVPQGYQPMPHGYEPMPQGYEAMPQGYTPGPAVYQPAPAYPVAGQPYEHAAAQPPYEYPAGQVPAGYAPQGYPVAEAGYGAGFAQAGRQPGRPNIPLIVAIGAVALALIAFLTYWFGFRDKSAPTPNRPVPTTPGQPTSPTTPTPTVSSGTAKAAVQGYLEALAAGDAQAALAYLKAPPADTTFMTNDILAKSIALGPITDIKVTEGTYGDVSATYQIGTQRVSANYRTTKYGNQYLLDEGTSAVNVKYLYQANIGMSLNGVSLDNHSLTSINLFPGTYQWGTSNSLLTFDPNQFVITDPTSYVSTSSAQLGLAADAQSKLAAAAKSALDSCLQEKALKTSCGFGFSSLSGGATPDLNTVTWALAPGSSDDFSNASFSMTYGMPTQVKAYVDVTLTIHVKDTNGESYSNRDSLFKATADIADPNAISVTFE